MSGSMSQLGDTQNMVYVVNVTFNGAPFSVMIDTGRCASFRSQLAASGTDLGWSALTYGSPLLSPTLSPKTIKQA